MSFDASLMFSGWQPSTMVWVSGNKLNTRRIAAWGSSAGGHLVALLGVMSQVASAFVLLALARTTRVLPDADAGRLTAAVALSMLARYLSASIFRAKVLFR